jgi:RHS repeat-associated protein
MATESRPHSERAVADEWSRALPVSTARSTEEKSFLSSPPAISLPKGGGAIRGIGEKFAANPVTGSATFSLPLPASPGRGGFGPQLTLSYDSSNGNGAFGFGWNLALPSISRKTDRGLPRYADGNDTFLISGAEDLVPVLDANNRITDDMGTAPGYAIRRYRPRIEGLFARIERWTRDDGDVHWRSISPDNVLSIYGKDSTSRIYDPFDPTRTFSWLISETRDDKGNAIRYEYKDEDGTGVKLTQTHEQCRDGRQSRTRSANRHIRRILYGNRRSLLDRTTHRRPRDLTPAQFRNADWMFELVFDYGEHSGFEPVGSETWRCRPDVKGTGEWPVRPDPFSTYRAGFEIRTYRLCRRVLMLHHFPQDAAVDRDCLVRSLDFAYRDSPEGRTHSNPGFTFLKMAAQRSYQRDPHDRSRYRYRSLPQLEFFYSEAKPDDYVRELDVQGLENMPIGLDSGYRWVDLDGEGLSGVLTEQAGAWYYKANLGEGPSGPTFAPLRVVAPRPSIAALNTSGQQLMDVAGSGEIALVDFHPPLAGFHQRDIAGGWSKFIPFANLPNIEWSDPNLRFVDLTGDGHADALITEHEVFTWYPSQATQGFGVAERTAIPLDERDGPRVVFADQEQSIYLADMSGDGLSDIVRVRNGQVCYWPNLGYGRFGKQVLMDASPWFEHEDHFDRRRIRLADVDGSGAVDLIYLGRDGARLWFNRSGNEWSVPRELPFPTASSNVDQIQVADLLGNGTACLVWSSDLPTDARRPMRYLDLMGGQKPHLMTKMINNLGAETEVDYAPSTKYYLQDKAAGTPWATKLPFPVHCMEKMTVRDRRRRTEFSTTYSYHHGYFDGVEREFRGFGRVEQVDTQRFDDFAEVNADSPYVTPDFELFQPPVKTITWFHTGIGVDRHRILALYEQEYFPARFASRLVAAEFAERELPQPEIDAGISPLDTDELREAMRACKGMALRQEAYELDLDALHLRNEHRPVRLFSAAQHNCHIRRVQPRGPNKHSVFLVTESEAVTYNYELALGGTDRLEPDPRVAHTLNLRFDDYGRARQSVAAGYPRLGHYDNEPGDPAPLTTEQLALIRETQNELHVAYTETTYAEELPAGDDHRLPAPCEVRTYELTGVKPDTAENRYFTLEALRRFRLDPTLDAQATWQVLPLDYQERPPTGAPHKRLVEHAVTLYFKDDLSGPRALGRPSRIGLTYENYKLALTDSLLRDVFARERKQDNFFAEALSALAQPGARPGFLASGYQKGSAVLGAQGAGQWWMRSGVAGFAASAADRFYLPKRYFDPFGNETTLDYDDDDLFVRSSTDPVGNEIQVTRFDHRVLAPKRVRDLNGNVNAVAFDVFGLPVAMAQMGKVSPGPPESGETGDTVEEFSFTNLNPDPSQVAGFFMAGTFDSDQARRWLGKATARFVYHFGESTDAQGRPAWGSTAAGACGILRELHEGDARNTPAAEIPIQVSVEYSDGAGQAFVKKIQAEPDPAARDRTIRWIANGKTIVNNKGNPVLQYEPYFSDSGHRFEEPQAVGVSPIMYYDAPGRLVRTEFADGSISRVEFSPWLSRDYDQNDTVLEPGNRWYAEHTAAGAAPEEKHAARLARRHADTPSETHFDSLGRAVIAIARNRSPDEINAPATATSAADWPWKEERYLTFTKLDVEGKPLWICDARGNLVMQYIAPPGPDHTPLYDSAGRDYRPAYFMPALSVPCYDIAGNPLFQHSMDAGDRRMLMDAAGQPLLAWDYNERNDATSTRLFKEHRRFRVVHDDLHRPLERWLRVRDEITGTTDESLVERFRYGEGVANDQALNLRGKVWQHYDCSGLAQTDAFDLSDKPLTSRRRLARGIEAPLLDWDGVRLNNIHAATAAGFERDVFTQRTEYDALGRISLHYNWHVESPNGSGQSERVAVYQPAYNERGLLAAETLLVRARKIPGGHRVLTGITREQDAITRIDYDAKGQKLRLDCGNGTVTKYDYDPKTFRLRVLRTTRPGYNPPFPSRRSQLSDPRVLQHLFYSYDPSGNITDIQDDAWRPAFFGNQQVDALSQYVYDAIYRLVEATGREDGAPSGAPPQLAAAAGIAGFPINTNGALRKYTQRYRYDAVGNIETMRHVAGPNGSWTRRYVYATDSNRLTATDTDKPTQAVTYGYDIHGSMLNLNAAPDRFDLRWDWNDMIHTIDLGGGGRAWYQYGADKQRCRKRVDNQNNTTGYWERICLGDYELYRRYNSANLTTPVEEIESHHLFEGVHRILLVDDVITASDANDPRPDGLDVQEQTLFRYQHSNHLGSACLELDDDAEIISSEEYHPYGTSAYHVVKSTVEAPPNRYRYTGMERDEESGLEYHWARYQAPWLGRWLSPDPSGTKDSLNRFLFCRARPTCLVDRDGSDSKETDFVVPEIEKMFIEKKIPYAREVTFVIDVPGKGRIPGRFDFVYVDPSTGLLAALEAKGADVAKLHANQPIYSPVFLSKEGGLAIFTTRKGGTLNLKAGSVQMFSGGNYRIRGFADLKSIASELSELTGGKAFKHFFAEEKGYKFFHTSQEFKAFLKEKKNMDFERPAAKKLGFLGKVLSAAGLTGIILVGERTYASTGSGEEKDIKDVTEDWKAGTESKSIFDKSILDLFGSAPSVQSEEEQGRQMATDRASDSVQPQSQTTMDVWRKSNQALSAEEQPSSTVQMKQPETHKTLKKK